MADLDLVYDVANRRQAFENHRQGLLACVAGPGTGKTFSLLRHIRSLTADDGVPPSSICYLTFIKEIARAFVSDYEDEFGEQVDDAKKPRVSTLHSFACRLIRNRGFTVGLDGPLYFASVADQSVKPSQVFTSDLLPLVAHLGPTSPATVRKLLETAKEAWRNNADLSELQDPIPAVLEVGLELGLAYRLVDWDQAIPLAHDLFLKPENRREWIAQLQYFMIDEYQDFNPAEQSFISTLASTVTSMIIVGDDNQSIYYRLRGSSPEGLMTLFGSERSDRVTLLECWRSKARILEAVSALLCSMCPGREPMTAVHEGGQIECYRFKSCKAEVVFLREFLSQRVDELPEQPRSRDGIVCLLPSWKALDFYFDQLSPSISCCRRKEPTEPRRAWLSQALQLVCNPHQRFIERLLLEDVSEIKPSHKKAMVQLILEKDISPIEALRALLDDAILKGAAATAARSLIELCSALSSQEPDRAAGAISDELGADPGEAQAHLQELVSGLGEVDQDDAIAACCDNVLPNSAAPAEDPRSVLFLTMHGSKGLTKRTVVMPGLEDAWLPGEASGASLEEWRRVFYVALSRATDRVLITYPLSRARGDPLNWDAPGRAERCRFVTQSDISCSYHE